VVFGIKILLIARGEGNVVMLGYGGLKGVRQSPAMQMTQFGRQIGNIQVKRMKGETVQETCEQLPLRSLRPG